MTLKTQAGALIPRLAKQLVTAKVARVLMQVLDFFYRRQCTFSSR